jgi:D-alanyl-D-alanine carboxypeptidase/D-alanyl-D-alanine-endopeptidase (penicillin-binding protein 4)
MSCRSDRRRASVVFTLALVTLPLAACHGSAHAAVDSFPNSASPGPNLAQLRRDLDSVLGDPALAHGTWGVCVQSLKSAETIYSWNPEKLLMPASNMKIVTLAAAAERLGWNYVYRTRVLAAGPIQGGVLAGDLVVVGSGDPSLRIADGSVDRVFGDWADQLKRRGVRTIDGRIVGDDRAFEEQTLGFGWSWDDLAEDYAAGVGALQFNENAVRVNVAPGPAAGDLAAISVEPPGGGIAVTSYVRTAPAGSATSLTVNRLPGHQQLEIRGSIAARTAAPAVLTVSVDNPTLFFVDALRRALIARGIDVRGAAVGSVDNADTVDNVISGPAIQRATPIGSHDSEPLSVLAQRLMKVSQNQYAETFLKTLSLAGGTASGRATAEEGRAAARKLFEAWGIDGTGLIQRDGSGLSRYDYVTAKALVVILSHVYHDERLRGPFEASLPRAASDGTLGNRLKGTAAEGRVRAKTGSMSNVRALSGYVTTRDSEELAFSIIANNFEGAAESVNRATDAIVIRLAEFRR